MTRTLATPSMSNDSYRVLGEVYRASHAKKRVRRVDIARELGMEPLSVKHHLQRLDRYGFVVATYGDMWAVPPEKHGRVLDVLARWQSRQREREVAA